MDIQYAYTILYVQDVPQTIEFYHKVFGFEEKFTTPEKDYGEIISGATTISFANLELATSNFKPEFSVSSLDQKPFGIELAFTTSDVRKLLDLALEHGAVQLAELQVKPWGQEVAYVRDLNGFIIEICTPMKG
ncbi:MAG: Lactoylglutathione lyase (EC [uncultured Aureispira sp.]|uniref:Lactoylglutathione lyase (EC) n=1 Tax=uncultured Aureispira sp. TaxID=1331704 RepID=A0A6S6TWX6_9BACT|nr:MAG: Lactoylglutathione lyase (EC [uncultured Aureispira sp.]